MSIISAEESYNLPDFLRESLVWDNHGCMPIRCDDSYLPQLDRYLNNGVDVVSINIGFDLINWIDVIKQIAFFRYWIQQHPNKYYLIESPTDINKVRELRQLGICFDIEGGNALNGNIHLIELYYRLGVRWMILAYNRNNDLAGGCLEKDDKGLTEFGKTVIDEMSRVGMVVCCSHVGYRTASEIMDYSSKPVIFSHSNPLNIVNNPRNIPDYLIKKCADQNGVIGINGVKAFLGSVSAQTVADMIDYIVQLVGVDYVGLGLDVQFDTSEVEDYVRNNPHYFPNPDTEINLLCNNFIPEQLPSLLIILQNRGYSDNDLKKIFGLNFLRIAEDVWH